LANVDRFSKFFHHQTQQLTRNDKITKYPTTLKRVAALPCEM